MTQQLCWQTWCDKCKAWGFGPVPVMDRDYKYARAHNCVECGKKYLISFEWYDVER